MAERRKHKRVKKRLQVAYGVDDLSHRGLATDISISGMFLDCRQPPDIGTRLHLHVQHPERDFYVEAEVVRVRRVDARLRSLKKEGVGLRFLSPAELIAASVPKEERMQATNTLVCTNAAAVKDLLSEQIYSRIVVVPVDEPAPELAENVEFTIRVEVGDGTEIDGRGRVLQIIGSEGSRQAVLEIEDSTKIRAALESVLA